MTTRPVAAGARADVRRRRVGLRLRDRPARRTPRREGRPARRLVRAAAGRRRRGAQLRGAQPGGREQVLRRPRRHHDHPAAGAARARLRGHGTNASTGAFDSMRTIAPPVGRGWEYLTGGYDWDTALGELPGLLAEKLAAPTRRGRPLRPGDPPLEPVADHPRVDRPRHRARPGAGLRGQLRRHVVRDRRPPRHAAVRLTGHERHRGPDHAARPGHHRVRRRGGRDPELGHHQGRRAGRLPARPADGADDARAQRRPVQRLCLRRLPRSHPHPADGQRLAAARAGRAEHRGADRPGGPRDLRRRGPVLVDRHAALQLPVHRPAVLPDRERPAGGPAARRRLPGDHHRLLELDGGRRRTGHLGAGRRLQLRQGPARARSRRCRTAARRRCSATSTS